MLLSRVTKLPLTVLVVSLVLAGLTAPAQAGMQDDAGAQPIATMLTLQAPARADATTAVPLTATLVRPDTGAPVAGAPVVFERRSGTSWRGIDTGTTDAKGTARATLTLTRSTTPVVVRAVFAGLPTAAEPLAGSVSEERTVTPVIYTSTVTVGGAKRLIDEKSTDLRLTWRADRRAVRGIADVFQRVPGGTWKKYTSVRFDAAGTAKVRVKPRVDTHWKAVGRPAGWWTADTSNLHKLDNVPPTAPVSYPAQAPRPRIALPRQSRAVGTGANGTASKVPEAVWRTMVGRSWHSGCPVGRSSLRLVQVNYWGYDGYRYRGELVVHQAIAKKTINAFTDLYAKRLPIRAMYRVDRFGWSSRLGGADNYGSMAAGNTSAFNCRGVVGNPSVRSPHSYGRSIDINTWENPYHSRTGIVPNAWWATHSHPKIGWRNASHPVVKVLRANGFRWTYGNSDAHHFDG